MREVAGVSIFYQTPRERTHQAGARLLDAEGEAARVTPLDKYGHTRASKTLDTTRKEEEIIQSPSKINSGGKLPICVYKLSSQELQKSKERVAHI